MTDETKGKTLAELDAQPGDVVRAGGYCCTIAENPHRTHGQVQTERGFLYSHDVCEIIHRANPTREQLDEQIAALTAQRDAMPKMYRIWLVRDDHGGFYANRYQSPTATMYRDFPIVDRRPEGFVDVKK